MKNRSSSAKIRSAVAFACALPAALWVATPQAASAATYYWDGNGATTGSGATTLAGNWDGGTPSAYWGTAADGTSATSAAAITSADTVVFSANDTLGTANNYNAGYTVTLGAAESVFGIVIAGASVGSGNSGGTLTLAGTGSPGLTIGAGGVVLNGSNGDPTFAASIGTITLGADQTWTTNNAHVWAENAIIAGNATAGNVRTWTLGYVNAFTTGVNGALTDGSAGGQLALTLNNFNGTSTGAGTYNITSTASTFTGKTTITRGILQIASLKNVGGGASSLGAVTTVSDGTIDIGSAGNPAASLVYNGSTASTSDRVINLVGSATISNNAASAANTLTLTSDFANAANFKTLTLSGTNTGNNTISGVIGDGFGVVAVAKTGAGTWVLNGNNTFSSTLNVSAGKLILNGTNDNINSVTISGGATVSMGASATLGFGSIALNNGFLLLGGDGNVANSGTLTIGATGGGIGVSYLPTATFPTVVDNSGTTGGIFGIGYTGTGGIGTVAGVDTLFTSSSYWFLGAFTGTTGIYTGSSLTAGNGNTYRLGGGGGTLTIQNNILVGSNNLLVGSNANVGILTLSNGNTFTGTTTLQNGTLNVASLNKVVGGTASSSLGAPITVANGTITLGSAANAVTLNYTGTGETTDRVLKFAGTTGTVTLSNSGSGAVNYSNTDFTTAGAGSKILVLGAATDSFGGSIGTIANNSVTNKTSVTKMGLSNSTWTLLGTSTYTGNTIVNGGVLSVSDVLASSPLINLAGTGTSNYAVLQGQGTFARTLTTGLQWGANSGFAAKGGKLTVTLNGGAGLTYQVSNFMGAGGSTMVFGSTTADNQVEFTNSFSLATTDAFAKLFYVEKGLGGDSALLSGVISNGTGIAAASGMTKQGKGMLILSGASTFSGIVTVSAGTLVAGANSTGTTSGAFGIGTGGSGAPTAPTAIILGDAGTGSVNNNPSILIGGAFTVDRKFTVSDSGTNNVYSLGGSTDNSSTFSGAITVNNSTATGNTFAITQVATTGGNALNITGGIVGGASVGKSITFNNIGAVNVGTGIIADGGANALTVNQTGSGVTRFTSANTYTGATNVTNGMLFVDTGGTINNTSGINLNGSNAVFKYGSGTALTKSVSFGASGGTFIYNSTAAFAGGPLNLGVGAVLGGSGNVGSVLIANGATLSPGNSPGTLTTGAETWGAGGTYHFEINNATGTAGSNWDLVSTSGLTINATSISKFTIDVYGLTAGNAAGAVVNFDSSTSFTWAIATGTGLGSLDTSVFAINTSNFTNNNSVNGAFTLGLSGGTLNLVYTAAVPEPSTWSALALGMGGLILVQRIRRKNRSEN